MPISSPVERPQFRITEHRKAILCAALSELDVRLSRGLANSRLHKETLRWWQSRNIHESEVGELLRLIKGNF